jgi:hypothetical protein
MEQMAKSAAEVIDFRAIRASARAAIDPPATSSAKTGGSCRKRQRAKNGTPKAAGLDAVQQGRCGPPRAACRFSRGSRRPVRAAPAAWYAQRDSDRDPRIKQEMISWLMSPVSIRFNP